MKVYKKIKKLGQGGNGLVLQVSDGKNDYAKKIILKYRIKRAYIRFRDEIEIIKNTPHNGIIEILDYYLPNYDNINRTPYYIMPLGIPLKDYLKNTISLVETFDIIKSIINTIEFLHSNNITHRDIKIENILMINNSPKLSDFGLANFPKQKRISKQNEKIGPVFTIAPEMKRISSSAEYKKADVYSLAKTVWVILTKNWQSFDGQYTSSSSIGLKNYIDLKINKHITIGETYYHSIVILEKLLMDATHNDPEKRPTIEEFRDRFLFWLNSNNDYFLRNGLEWRDAIERIFPISVPNTSSWYNINEIKEVLRIIFSSYDQLNHSFFPKSGGMDFENVDIIKIHDFDYLLINKRYLISPESLIFEFMDDFEWSYFRLNINEKTPIFGTKVYLNEEILYINEDGEVFENDNINYGEVRFFLNGSFLIVQKISKINNLSDDFDHYNGLHNKMNNNEYKDLLQKIKCAPQSRSILYDQI